MNILRKGVPGLLLALFFLSCTQFPPYSIKDLQGEWKSLDGSHTIQVTNKLGTAMISSRKVNLCGHFATEVFPIRNYNGSFYVDNGFMIFIEYDWKLDRLRLTPGKEYKRVNN